MPISCMPCCARACAHATAREATGARAGCAAMPWKARRPRVRALADTAASGARRVEDASGALARSLRFAAPRAVVGGCDTPDELRPTMMTTALVAEIRASAALRCRATRRRSCLRAASRRRRRSSSGAGVCGPTRLMRHPGRFCAGAPPHGRPAVRSLLHLEVGLATEHVAACGAQARAGEVHALSGRLQSARIASGESPDVARP